MSTAELPQRIVDLQIGAMTYSFCAALVQGS